jgi:hypothetical protein
MVLLNTAMLHQVRCIRKGAPAEGNQCITHIGGGLLPRVWSLPAERAIAGMEQGYWCFCVIDDDRFLPVVIATSPSGQKYLKTAVDGEQSDHLLSLPECVPSSGGTPGDEFAELPC